MLWKGLFDEGRKEQETKRVLVVVVVAHHEIKVNSVYIPSSKSKSNFPTPN